MTKVGVGARGWSMLRWWCKTCHWSLLVLILLHYDGIPLSKSLIFRYTCALFCRTRFQHTCLTSKINDFRMVLATFWKHALMEFQAMFKKAYKTCVFLMVLKVRGDQSSQMLIFRYTCDKSRCGCSGLIYAALVVQKMSLVLASFDTFEKWLAPHYKISVFRYTCALFCRTRFQHIQK